jgi:hypothetical protein
VFSPACTDDPIRLNKIVFMKPAFEKFRTLRGPTIAADFKALVIDYINQRYGAGAKPTAAE